MGFFDKTNVEWPEELKEFKGKSQEELARAIREQAAENAKLTERLAASDTKLASIDTEFSAIKDKLAQLSVAPVIQTQQQRTIQQPTSFDENPDQAFNERIQPLVTGMMLANAKSARLMAENIINGDPKMAYMMKEFRTDVEKAFTTIPLQGQTDPNSYIWTLKALIGDKFETLTKTLDKNHGSFFAETNTEGNTQGFKTSSNGSSSDVVLDDKDRELIRKSGLTEAGYLASKKKLLAQMSA